MRKILISAIAFCTLFTAGAPAAQASVTSFTNVQQVSDGVMTVILWRNNSNSRLHSQVINARGGGRDAVFGCPEH
ncbi:hypothetical protein [Actinokineospora enzanensis]|uniref:hypothetical protein n=1 Tax=Actinokineospora enzanensis TaxID=155975 RepID=UPI0012EBF74B|nr:hypothetical protein [Actinokineospora enzanensis]